MFGVKMGVFRNEEFSFISHSNVQSTIITINKNDDHKWSPNLKL